MTVTRSDDSCRMSSMARGLSGDTDDPPGSGVAGAANPVFSVSSFMDTLDPDEVTVEEAVPA